MMNRKSRNGGFSLALSLVAAMVISGLALSIANLVRANTRNKVTFDNMRITYQKAESAMNRALGRLSIDGRAFENDPTLSNPITEDKTVTSVRVLKRNFADVNGGYYLITEATTTTGGRRFSLTLHTYARVSNVGEYFAAINGPLAIADGIDLSLAKVYGRSLDFAVGAVTQIKKAEFVSPASNCTPAPTSNSFGTNIRITEGVTAATGNSLYFQPHMLNFELLFPQLLEADLVRYQEKAHLPGSGPEHRVCNFSGDIYPPGYSPVVMADTYAGHTNSNNDHVYYCDGDMTIEGRVIGQVLFVAEGDIHITGDLIVASTDTASLNYEPLPGVSTSGNPGASAAHQAVLMTREDVIVDRIVTTVPTQLKHRIEALVFAPQGTIQLETYPSEDFHNNLQLEFEGSMILNETPSFNSVYKCDSCTGGPRIYRYMNSLLTNPPPDLPTLSEIYYSLEQTVRVGDKI